MKKTKNHLVLNFGARTVLKKLIFYADSFLLDSMLLCNNLKKILDMDTEIKDEDI